MKKLISIILVILMLTTVVFAKVEMNDVQKQELYKYGIMVGDPDGNLRLNDTITRAEAVKMIASAAGFTDSATISTQNVFPDVYHTHWAYKYICFAKEQGIVNGDENGLFNPEDSVTNEEFIKMLVCLLGYEIVAEAHGGYPVGHRAAASSLEITADMNFDTDVPAIRNDIGIMMHRALDVFWMVQTSYGADVVYNYADGKEGRPHITIRTRLEELLPIEEVPRFNGPEYIGRIVQIKDLQYTNGVYTFKNALDEKDDATYRVTANTFIYKSVNTVELDEIANGKYAQCWHYTDDTENIELLKIEIMKEKPSGI